MLISRRSRGFTMIELMIGVTIIGVLLALALPSFTAMLQSARMNAAARSYQSGLQVARAEAIRRNLPVEFVLTDTATNAADLANTVSGSNSGKNWVVRTTQQGVTGFVVVESKAAREGASTGITVSGSASAGAFDGIVTFNGFGGTTTGLTYSIDVANPAGGDCAVASGPMRCPRIRVSPGGQVAMCDPAVTDASDTRKC